MVHADFFENLMKAKEECRTDAEEDPHGEYLLI